MAVDEQDNTSESTPGEAELQRQIDGLQSQVTDLHKAREATENPELSSEVQSLKEKLDEHSKQLEQSAEKLTQFESENLVLRDNNQALNTTSNKKRRFLRQPYSEKETSEGAAALQSSFDHLYGADVLQQARRHAIYGRKVPQGNPCSYADTPFTNNTALIETPRKFSFPNIKMYDGTGDPDDHIAQYKQRMLAVALPREFCEATMCKGFGSTLIGAALQ
ncbi:hypothetical protein F2Q68_00021807 [Brassica cretica]|uniref:Uncharacterized protein n=1 Tax=Brassica cretica TaxID=69181 RepID=A0A8S9G0I3_BRACR|nr:hypothetical protein F2Q68_00021807 [Brassica cretica]